MEVHAIDTLSGREEPLELDPDATVSTMKRRCGEALGFGEDVELSVGGQRVACDGAERISNIAGFSGGCQVRVVRGVAEFVAQLRSGAVTMDDIPGWARQRRECVLAVLARALESRAPILPHWVHPSLHDDKEVMLEFVRCDRQAFLRASAELRSDADVVIAALKQDASMWEHVVDKSLQDQRSVAVVAVPHCANSAVWLSDRSFVLEALENKALMLTDVNATLREDKEVLMKALDVGVAGFGDLSEGLRGDKDFVMEALLSGRVKEFHQVSATLQQDKEVVMQALSSDVKIHFYRLGTALQEDKEVVMKAMTSRRLKDFHQLSATLQQDKEVVMEALSSHRSCGIPSFSSLSTALQEDKDVVMGSLSFKNHSVQFGALSESLRGDRDVVEKAVSSDSVTCFHDLSTPLQEDKKILLAALGRVAGGSEMEVTFSRLSEAMRGDKAVVMRALYAGCLKDFHQVSAALQLDQQVVMQAFHNKVVEFGDLSESLRGNKSFVLRAFDVTTVAYSDIASPLRQDRVIALKAADRPSAFVSMDTALRDDLEVALAAIRGIPSNFIYAGDSVRANKQAALAAFSRYDTRWYDPPVLLPFASAELQADHEVVLAAVRANPQNAIYASPALQDLVASGRAANCITPNQPRDIDAGWGSEC